MEFVDKLIPLFSHEKMSETNFKVQEVKNSEYLRELQQVFSKKEHHIFLLKMLRMLLCHYRPKF